MQTDRPVSRSFSVPADAARRKTALAFLTGIWYDATVRPADHN